MSFIQGAILQAGGSESYIAFVLSENVYNYKWPLINKLDITECGYVMSAVCTEHGEHV